MADLKLINERLEKLYGQHINASDKAMFRLILATGVTEKRYGVFEGHTESGIYVGTETGIKEVLKYAWAQGSYVLERLVPNPHTDIVGEPMSYEPLWVFDKDKEVTWKWVEIVLYSYFACLRGDHRKIRNDADVYTAREAELKKQQEYIENYFYESRELSALRTGQGVFIPSKG